tara:strand:+ start:544 stop:1233 length:690 start_codon:yes stop_codon:yes gene_type:complete
MKNLIFTSFFLFSICLCNYSQNKGQLWLETGLKTKITRDLAVNAELNNRIGSNGLRTSFTQISIKYKVIKWLSASLDYRIISKKQENTNYLNSNRINANLGLSHKKKRFYGNFRLRYQYAFGRIFNSNYEPDFDNAIRFRPRIKYDIENSIFTPHLSTEFYYNPTHGPLGKRFNKIRTTIGVDFEIDGPHEFGLQFIYDKKINLPDPTNYLILKLSYAYKIAFYKKNKR